MRDFRNLTGLIRRLIREELREMGVARVRRPKLSALSSDALATATLSGFDKEDLDAFVAQPFGLASRIPNGTELVIVRSGSQWVVVGARDRDHRPSGLADGETAIYSTKAALVLNADGSLVYDGGTHKVAKVGDNCTHSLVSPPGGGTVTGSISVDLAAGSAQVLVP